MTLREAMAADLDVFVRMSEFGELIEIDGVLCKAQMMIHTADKSSRQAERFEGLHGEFVELYFMASPYLKKHDKLPHRGDLVYVQGRRYEVVHAEDERGMIHLLANAYRQSRPRRGDSRVD